MAYKYNPIPTVDTSTNKKNMFTATQGNLATEANKANTVTNYANRTEEAVPVAQSVNVGGAPKQNPANTSGNNSGDAGGGNATAVDPYANYYNQMIALYEKQLAEEKARQAQVKQARINAANTTYDTSLGNLNDAKESSLRQAYIKHMQEQKALPQQMQAYGLSGGATETNLANMKNVYGTNRTNIMNEAMAQQRMIEQDRANAIANAEADAANYEANAIREYNNGLLNVYASALNSKAAGSTPTTSSSNIRKNPWYDVAVEYLKLGESQPTVITLLREQGVSDDIIDAIMYDWESTI